MYMAFQYFFKGKSNTNVTTTDSVGKALPPLANAWSQGQLFDLQVYLTEHSDFDLDRDAKSLIWQEYRIPYDWSESATREKNINITPTYNMQHNGSIYAHITFKKSGVRDPSDPTETMSVVHQMNRYSIFKKKVLKSLVGGEEPAAPVQPQETPEVAEVLSYWKPNLTLHLIEDQSKYGRGSLPDQILGSMIINDELSTYQPVIYVNEFWLLRDHLIAINESVTSLPLTLQYSPFSLTKWQMFVQMDQSFAMQQSMGAQSEGESDEFKRMILETNPYLLALTAVVTLLHSVFDFLAFKNDIHFWKNKKNLEGMSVRTLFLNLICQIIIFLYLLDDGETSWMIIISCGVGLAIEFWKLKKAVIIELDWSKSFPLTFKDRESYVSKTREYDVMAMRYLSYVLYPLIVGYSMYALYYHTHKSWYSWIITSLSRCVYLFGFIMMCPQLFINYKLKSVAHLPWRTFAYKALNTFIDDLFAFIIKMPTLHRLSCFRDDIIFLIYLYQRWIYRVDYSRVNEFGQGGEDTAEPHTATRPVDVTNERPPVDEAKNSDGEVTSEETTATETSSPTIKKRTVRKKE
eukprot:TRINITY_DN6158_c0_g1_i3.p1 TRINITY_DN6158_c0_g1~~TRINITY_DN6158_c0_g1_i3.p1  ORF type:complete len:586 (+),score=148.64 TRINITY_DN6158_c0_g1_i3:36-1760(+)